MFHSSGIAPIYFELVRCEWRGIEVCMAAPRLRDRGFHTKSCKFIFNVVAIFKAFIRNRGTSATYAHETVTQLTLM